MIKPADHWDMDYETKQVLFHNAFKAIEQGNIQKALKYAYELERGGYPQEAEDIRSEIYYTA